MYGALVVFNHILRVMKLNSVRKVTVFSIIKVIISIVNRGNVVLIIREFDSYRRNNSRRENMLGNKIQQLISRFMTFIRKPKR